MVLLNTNNFQTGLWDPNNHYHSGSDGNEAIFHTPQCSRTRASPSDAAVVLYPYTSFCGYLFYRGNSQLISSPIERVFVSKDLSCNAILVLRT